jgi:uncharacterized damage-inducible protein DinB
MRPHSHFPLPSKIYNRQSSINRLQNHPGTSMTANTIPIVDDLYRYNTWANDRILALSADLSNEQLDEPREIGFGSLRNTLFHILAAEQIWLERWQGAPWRPLPTDAGGLPVAEIGNQLRQTAADRQAVLDRGRSDGWQSVCQYKDSKGNPYSNPLVELLLHVANHGIHHRAQALHFLKGFGRTVPGGLDYLFFRLAQPFVPQEESTQATMRQYGLEIGTGTSPAVSFDAVLVRNYFAYGDWANARLLQLVEPLDDAALDRSFGMGMDTIRRTVLHICDAERWWLRNWTSGPSAFDKAPLTTSTTELREQWKSTRAQRTQFLSTLDAGSAQRVVTATTTGALSLRLPVIESLVQLCGHGTHHRAQLINMLRRSGVTPPSCDYLIWLREPR